MAVENRRHDLLGTLYLYRQSHRVPVDKTDCQGCAAALATETIHLARFIIADGEIAAHRELRDCFDVRILVLAGWSRQWRARMGRDRSERVTSLRKPLTLSCISNLFNYSRFSAGAAAEAGLILRRSRCGRHFTRQGT